MCVWARFPENPRDAFRGPGATKGSKSMGSPTGGEWRRISPLSANGRDKHKRFLPLFSRVSRCSKVRWMWSATVSKRIIRWNLRSDTSEPGPVSCLEKSLHRAGHFWITLEASGRLGCGVDRCVTKTPLNETLPCHTGQEPNREWTILRRTGREEPVTFGKTHCAVYSTAATCSRTLHGVTMSSQGLSWLLFSTSGDFYD